MNRILQLQQDRSALETQAKAILEKAGAEKRAMTADENAAFDKHTADMQAITETLNREQQLSALSNLHTDGGRTRTSSGVQIHDNNLDRPFGPEARAGETAKERRIRCMHGFGEQLLAIRQSALNPASTDQRLFAINDLQKRGPAGASEAVPADGGFLVYPDFSNEVLMIAHEVALIYPKARKLPLSEATNAIKIPGIDEQSRATGSRWGGVRVYWQNEADSTTVSKPKFRLVELVTKKLMALYYATDELLADARALGSIITQAYGEEIAFMLDDMLIHGSGSGQGLGILNSNALVTQAKETGQPSATILWENIKNMLARCYPRSFKNAEWFVNINCMPTLMSMVQVVGTAGVPVWLPPGAASASPYGTLMGRPVNVIEQSESVGTVGDILLADFSQYVTCDKGDPQQAVSAHVRFLTDEQTFRWVYRVDGQPIWHTALTPFKGSNALSPFVALAAR